MFKEKGAAMLILVLLATVGCAKQRPDAGLSVLPTFTVMPGVVEEDIKVTPLPKEGNPKLGSSLNQLVEAYDRGGLAEAQAFARTRGMVLRDDRVQVEVVAAGEAMSDLIEAVEAVGGEYQGHYETLLQALVPIVALESLAERPDVQVIREPQRAVMP